MIVAQSPSVSRAARGSLRCISRALAHLGSELNLNQLLDHAQPGDSLCVVRLDRPGCCLRELLKVVDVKEWRIPGSK
jgi:hypothetical protein